MKRIFLSVWVMVLITNVHAQKAFVNDANAEKRIINGSFNAIKISGGIDLYLSQYETEAIAVSATEQQYKNNIKTDIENNTLKIYYDGERNWKGNKNMKVYVSFKNLQKLQASGSCDIQVAGSITGNTLILEMSGASDFKGDVRIKDNLSLNLSGASDTKISGTATNVIIESSGASDVIGYELITKKCTAKASGASDINITVNEELIGNASGASDISYKGTGIIKQHQTSGASSISKKH